MGVFNSSFYKSISSVAALLLLGGVVGYKISFITPCVVYVSQEEILEFEKARIQEIEDPKEKQMFFGKPKEAAVLMENIASQLNSRDQIVVFSAGKVYGTNVISVSEDVYTQAMESLKRDNKL